MISSGTTLKLYYPIFVFKVVMKKLANISKRVLLGFLATKQEG